MTYITIFIISIVLLIPGLIMSFIPSIPNLVYMFLTVTIFGFYDKFTHLTPTNILILGIISMLAMIIDFISGIVGAKWGGAHWTSIISGLIGLIVGSAFIPIPIFGSLIGMFLGVLASEFYRTNDIRKANRAAMGSFFGTVAGIGVRVVASFIFFILFIIYAWN